MSNKIENIDFSRIDGNNIELEKHLPSIGEKLETLQTTLETREGFGKTSKELLGFNLDQTNFLSRLGEVSEICNNNKQEFLNICSQNLDLKLS